jgi:hypothetical protein
MNNTIRCEASEGFLRVEAWGDYCLGAAKTLAAEVRERCRALGQIRVLVDITRVQGPIPAPDRYEIGVLCAEILGHVRLALLARPDQITRLFEDVARNRGMAARIESDTAAAVAWLRQAPAPLRGAA